MIENQNGITGIKRHGVPPNKYPNNAIEQTLSKTNALFWKANALEYNQYCASKRSTPNDVLAKMTKLEKGFDTATFSSFGLWGSRIVLLVFNMCCMRLLAGGSLIFLLLPLVFFIVSICVWVDYSKINAQISINIINTNMFISFANKCLSHYEIFPSGTGSLRYGIIYQEYGHYIINAEVALQVLIWIQYCFFSCFGIKAFKDKKRKEREEIQRKKDQENW